MPHEFDSFNPRDAELLRLADGDIDEARLLARAVARAAPTTSGGINFDGQALATFRRSWIPGFRGSRGSTFRDAQRISDQELRMSARRLAFSGPPDSVREEHSAFCLLMYQNYQMRFLDRHPGETPEAFIDRPRKTTLNITRVIINALSQLYHSRPARKLADSTADQIKLALEGDDDAGVTPIWSDAYDLELLEADRYTRLEGTVGIRPFYDPDEPGKIKLWVFHSHQLRVIPDPMKPWRPKAVIERHEPFDHETEMVVWTAKTFLQFNGDGAISEDSGPHGLGRIPVVIFRDRKASTGSFFVEGRGRGLCDANAVINGKLTDLNEVYQYQGFAVPQVVNAEEEDLVLGPRRPVRFNPEKGQPFGIEFKQPRSQLRELKANVDGDVDDQFKVNGVPPAAVGAEINKRTLSGKSIRESMRPILNDLKERARIFTPLDIELSDVALRVRAEHDPDFSYDPKTQKPRYTIDYVEPDLPFQIQDQLAIDEFDIAHGKKTVPDLMRRDDPDKFESDEAAETKWKENVALTNSVRIPGVMPEETPGEDARLGTGRLLADGELPQWLVDEAEEMLAEAEASGNGNGGESTETLLTHLLTKGFDDSDG